MPLALLSVFDKTQLVEFARGLKGLDWDLLASGGTARVLRDAGLSVLEVAEYTGSPEILNGRVKTLHPAVAGGLLARDTQEDARDLSRINARFIDLVACNLYPFESVISSEDVALADALENIDIGGLTLLRAAGKNYQRVIVINDPEDYDTVLAELKSQGAVTPETRRSLAEKAFARTAAYDAAIARFLQEEEQLQLHLHPVQTLRYGENWHQEAQVYGFSPRSGPLGGQQLQGKPLSYNNLLDLDAAWRAVNLFERPTVCIVKHLSPCGIASADDLAAAYQAALNSDPVSAFGSVIAVNRPLDKAIAAQLRNLFVECIAAPRFDADGRDILSKKENLRILEMSSEKPGEKYEYRSIVQGMVRQTLDVGDPSGAQWRVVTKRAPTDEEWIGLRFAWRACQPVKSNAVVFAVREATVGIGGGQPNRVDCVKIAADRAGERSKGAVMASDAFFPFPDIVEAAVKCGITAIIQPGGSIRDDLSIEVCNEHNLAMVFTGVRHFRH